MLGFSVIGTPEGFEISSIMDNEKLSVDSLVDLDNSVINIFPDTDILMIIREVSKNAYRHYFVYYRFALEISTTRTGTFYGSVVTITNRIPTMAGYVTYALKDLAEVIQRECITQENRFNRKIKNLKFSLPTSLNELGSNVKKSELFEGTYDRKGFFYVGKDEELKNYDDLIRQVFANPYLANYKVLYASSNMTVFRDVRDKGQLEILSLKKIAELKEKEDKEQQQQQLKQEQIRLQLQAENDEREKKEREAKEARQRNQQSQKNTQNDISERLSNLEDVTNELKNEIKELRKIIGEPSQGTDLQREKISIWKRISNIWKRISNIFDVMSWGSWVLIVLGIAIILTVVIFAGLYSFNQNNDETNAANVNNNTVAATSVNQSSKSNHSNNESSNPSDLPSVSLNNLIQIKYKEEAKTSIPTVRTVSDLIRRIKSQCGKTPISDKDLIASIRRINKSINDGKGREGKDFNDAEIENFELLKIDKDVVFEIPSECKILEIDGKNYELNSKSK